MQHQPIMVPEILEKAREMTRQPEWYFDGTFGRGGHVKAFLDAFPKLQVVAMDRDADAMEFGQKEFSHAIESGQVHLLRGSHQEFKECLNDQFDSVPRFDFMLLDLGVSSPQLDQAHRGFSFYHDGPLDMRMDHRQERTAAEIVNEASEERLIELFQTLGEVPRPYRVVRAMVHDRTETPFTTTRDLAALIERVEGWSKKGHHPATRYFMALRLEVNQELQQLEEALPEFIESLQEKGRLAVLTFHSLEDRLVKNFFKSRKDLGQPVNKKVIIPPWSERKKNPRARSAKLRVFQKETSSAESSSPDGPIKQGVQR